MTTLTWFFRNFAFIARYKTRSLKEKKKSSRKRNWTLIRASRCYKWFPQKFIKVIVCAMINEGKVKHMKVSNLWLLLKVDNWNSSFPFCHRYFAPLKPQFKIIFTPMTVKREIELKIVSHSGQIIFSYFFSQRLSISTNLRTINLL